MGIVCYCRILKQTAHFFFFFVPYLHLTLSEKVNVGCVAKMYAVEFSNFSHFIAHNSRKSAVREQLVFFMFVFPYALNMHILVSVVPRLSRPLPSPPPRRRAFPNLSGRVFHGTACTKSVFLFSLLSLCGARAWAFPAFIPRTSDSAEAIWPILNKYLLGLGSLHGVVKMPQ